MPYATMVHGTKRLARSAELARRPRRRGAEAAAQSSAAIAVGHLGARPHLVRDGAADGESATAP